MSRLTIFVDFHQVDASVIDEAAPDGSLVGRLDGSVQDQAVPIQ